MNVTYIDIKGINVFKVYLVKKMCYVVQGKNEILLLTYAERRRICMYLENIND